MSGGVLTIPLEEVARGPRGVRLAEAAGRIDGAALVAAVTESELHLGWIARKGPAYVIDLNALIRAAITEIERRAGQGGGP